MRILLVVVYYLPSTMSSAKLISDMAREFRRRGHEPIVAAPDDTILTDCEVTTEDGIKVVRIKTGEIKAASRWVRAWREITLSRLMWRKGRTFFLENPCDLVVYYSPTIFFGGFVKTIREHFGCPSYLILRDIFPQWAVDAGVLRRGSPIDRFFRQQERKNYEAASVIGVQSPANLSYFTDNGLDRKYCLEVLYNWAETTEIETLRGKYRQSLGLTGKIVFFYGGNIGVAQDMDNIIRLAENMQQEAEAYFLLVGDGSEVLRLKAMIEQKKLKNIRIHPAVDQNVYLEMLAEFDIGLLSLDKNLKTQNFPGKMLSYMDKAKPVLASINPGNDLQHILEEHQAGLVSINGQDQFFTDHARQLLKDGHLRREMGVNARRLLEHTFSVTRAARQILSHFQPVSGV